MSTTTTIYMDQNINGKEVKLPIILNEIKTGLNEIIKKSYEEHKIHEKESIETIPMIRNKAMLKSFSYDPYVHDDFAYQSLSADFIVFVEPQHVAGYPQVKFNMAKENAQISHQARRMHILTDNNFDISHHLDNVNEKNNFISISIGGDVVAQNLMKQLAQNLNEKLGCETYYLRTDTEDLEKIEPTKKVSQSKKVKP